MRSTQKHADVSEIAFTLGGGGHAEASGVRVPYVTNRLPGEVYNYGKFYNILKNVYFGKINVCGNEYVVVYLQSHMYKKELSNYLLQTKYKTNRNKSTLVSKDISVSQSLLMNQCENAGHTGRVDCQCNCEIQLSAIWSYDPCTNTTSFIIGLCDNLKKQKNEFDDWFKVNIDMDLEYMGFHQVIPIDPPTPQNNL